MATNSEQNAEVQSFVESMAAKLDAAATPPAAPAPDAPEAPAPESVPVAATDDPAIEPATPDAPADAPESDDAADDATEPDDDDPSPAAEATEDDPTDDAAPRGEFADALTREGVKVTLDDITDPTAKAYAQQRIRDLEAGFTKARQRDTAQLVELRAEQRVWKERPVDAIAELIRRDPALIEAVNARIDELEHGPIAAEAHETVMRDVRAKAQDAERQSLADEAAQEAARRQDVDALESHLEQTLAAHKVTPGKALERMLAATAQANAVRTGSPTLTRADIDAIVADYAADVREAKRVARESAERQQRREREKQYHRDKAADRAAALPIKPGTGSAPGVGAPPKPRTPEEFADYMAAKLAQAARSAA